MTNRSHNGNANSHKNDAHDDKNAMTTDTNSDPNIKTQKSTITFAIAQAHFLVGDIDRNVSTIRRLAKQAKSQGADVIVFPELALIGYPPEDLLLRPDLSQRINDALASLSDIDDIVMLIGYPHIDNYGTFNSVAIIHDGQQRGFYHKQHLPNQGVFDERRYFDKGRNQVLFDFSGITIGLLVGEDLWQETAVNALKEQGADVVVSLNASAFTTGKQNARKSLLGTCSADSELPIIYVNGVGGQDDLVFDGGSMVIQADGSIAHEADRFLPTLLYATLDSQTRQFDTQAQPPLVLSEPAERYQALVVGLRDYVTYSIRQTAKHADAMNTDSIGVIVGLSGGIDSALTLCIAVDALGADRVYAVMMPYKYTAQTSLEDAQAQAYQLGVSYTVCPIHDAVDGMYHTLAPLFEGTKSDATHTNLQARARGMVLMALSNKFGHLVVTSGNKSELAVGHNTLYGDMAGGFDVLKDVYKSQVYELAHYRNSLQEQCVIPKRVIERAPSVDLKLTQMLGQTAENPAFDHKTLDNILRLYIDEDMSCADIIEQGYSAQVVKPILQLVDNSEYKRRQAAIGTKVSNKAFGRERRFPLVNGWQF